MSLLPRKILVFELEMQCALAGISKIEVLREIGHQVGDYLFFVSDDGMFNWIDSAGNHAEDPSLLKKLEEKHVPKSICRCIVPRSVTCIGECAFYGCKSLRELVFKWKTLEEVKQMKSYPFGIEDESIIRCET